MCWCLSIIGKLYVGGGPIYRILILLIIKYSVVKYQTALLHPYNIVIFWKYVTTTKVVRMPREKHFALIKSYSLQTHTHIHEPFVTSQSVKLSHISAFITNPVQNHHNN